MSRPRFLAGRRGEHEVAVLVHGGGPAGVHERAGVVLLDDRGAVDDIAAQELPAVEHQGRAKAADFREPDITAALQRGRGRGAAFGQRRAASASSAISPPRKNDGSSRPSARFASVMVGVAPPRP